MKQFVHRIASVNGQDMSLLFESPFNFEQEILFCFVQLVGIGNYYNYNYNYPFTYWNNDFNSCEFLSASICCVLEMLFNIAKENNKQDA